MATAFGEYFRELRASRGVPLRQFCLANGYDAGNISKLERGGLPPPTSAKRLREHAQALKLKEGSDEWVTFFGLAAVARQAIPADIMADEGLLSVHVAIPRLHRDFGTDGFLSADMTEISVDLRVLRCPLW